jgi:hypothetical protein
MSRALTATAAAVALVAWPAAAAADEEPNGHGIVGGALVGAELTLIGEAIFAVEPTWAYVVGGVVGGIAGGYAGSLAEQRAEREVSLVLLAAGVGLLIPTAVWVGNARQPRPPPEQLQLLLPRARVAWGDQERGPSVSVDMLRGRF